MSAVIQKSLFDEITDFLASHPSDIDIIGYRLPEALAARAIDLLERHAEDGLSDEEVREMEDFIRIEAMMSLLKAKASLLQNGR
ncbi:MAG: hypothetical protein MUD01_19315 [Chloroflexaceae bacterium]|jgi:hypothetical protein|nr:hypothetical protein [Chloroflexaceae bacterium]